MKNADRFGSRGQCLLVAAEPIEPDAEVVQPPGEAWLVGGGVVGGQGAMQGDGLLGGFQRLLIAAFEQVLAARLTTRPPKAERPALVPLGPGEVMTAWVSCDDIETIYDDEVRADVGALTAPAMRRVEAGLRASLGMTE